MSKLIIKFSETDNSHVAEVGGKNASLGEMFRNLKKEGVNVPDGFATTAWAFRSFLKENQLGEKLAETLSSLDRKEYSNLKEVGEKLRKLVREGIFSDELSNAIKQAYRELMSSNPGMDSVAVRSSATAEDLPNASFAGQHDSYLNIRGEDAVVNAVQRCFVSLFNDRAIKYREDNGFDHMSVALSAGVQLMVRSDLASSGVCFTIEPETGHPNIILLTGSWGLGENVVQGAVNPDEFYLFKPSLENGKNPLIAKKLGSKLQTMIYASVDSAENTVNVETPEDKRNKFVLSNDEVSILAQWMSIIEKHYKRPMDIEWAKDGKTGQLFIVQARPETVHGKNSASKIHEYKLKEKGKILATGAAIGSRIASGVARVLQSPKESSKLREGEILITTITNPDWDPIMRKASAIVTDKGGRTSHAAIVARELGAVAVVGTGNASSVIKDGDEVTVCCSEGKTGYVFEGKLQWEEFEMDTRDIRLPKTKPMFILADPEKAFGLSSLPNQGVGLLRLEFIINNSIKAHPMALVHFDSLRDAEAKKEITALTTDYQDKKKYFVEKLAESVATVAAAFYPKDVIVRMSDFKSNEYRNLSGGKEFELAEENPMIGFRGASRYYNERYRAGFNLECEAMKKVRDEMGLTNVKLMIPFCRTVEEGKKVLQVMEENGLKRGQNGLKVYVMAEIPSNVILAEEFAKIFDGFSIGSNDLTQLTLGIDRDSSIISESFDERNPAAIAMIRAVIQKAKSCGTVIGFCGQAPSDFPDYAQILVEEEIDSVSFNPDALITGIINLKKAEDALEKNNKALHTIDEFPI